MRPVLCVEPSGGRPIASGSAASCSRSGESFEPTTRAIETILFHPSFPVDIRHNAKIFREKLAVWAARKLEMNALVTGGGGFLGGAIVRGCVARGDAVRSLSRGDYPALGGPRRRAGRGATWPIATRVPAPSRACDVVFHVAAKAGIWGPYDDYHRTQRRGDAERDRRLPGRGVRRLVYTSSPSVVFDGRDMEGVDESAPYPEHYEAAYPATKAEAEQLVLRRATTATAWRRSRCGRT